MTELIKVTENKGKKLVSARELYSVLKIKTHFRDWANRKIVENPFFEENEDFIRVLNFERAGQPALEFALTIEMAKKLAMSENNEVGNQVRNYFLEMEKKAIAKQFEIPQTLSQALMLAAKQAEQIELQQAEIKELTPKAEFFDTVTESKDTIDMGNAAKVLNMGMGRNKLFEFLRDKKVLMPNNKPYQTFIDRGYFRVIETTFDKPDGSTHINIKTLIYQKGLNYIKQLIETHEITKI